MRRSYDDMRRTVEGAVTKAVEKACADFARTWRTTSSGTGGYGGEHELRAAAEHNARRERVTEDHVADAVFVVNPPAPSGQYASTKLVADVAGAGRTGRSASRRGKIVLRIAAERDAPSSVTGPRMLRRRVRETRPSRAAEGRR